MLARLDAPGRDNEWGRIGDTREHLRRRLPGHQDRLREFGAIPIDARQPLDQVVDAILSHTLASSATSTSAIRSSSPVPDNVQARYDLDVEKDRLGAAFDDIQP